MFINNLTTCIQHCKYFLYADDIVMFKTLDTRHRALDFSHFQEDILSIENWCLQNELTINIKTSFVTSGWGADPARLRLRT